MITSNVLSEILTRETSATAHLRRGDVRATSGLLPRAARLGPLINCGTDQNEPSFTLVLVESGSVPKAIEFVLDPPADIPPA
jgi:hypothetical protein